MSYVCNVGMDDAAKVSQRIGQRVRARVTCVCRLGCVRVYRSRMVANKVSGSASVQGNEMSRKVEAAVGRMTSDPSGHCASYIRPFHDVN